MAALWHFLFDTPDINVRSILPQFYNLDMVTLVQRSTADELREAEQ